jgi:transposase
MMAGYGRSVAFRAEFRVVRRRDAVIEAQVGMLEEWAAAAGELRADVVALAARVGQLRRRLGRNSGNSSMGPSADDLPGRTPPSAKPRRGKGGRKPGGQPGAPGSHLAWSTGPDGTVPHFPTGRARAVRT